MSSEARNIYVGFNDLGNSNITRVQGRDLKQLHSAQKINSINIRPPKVKKLYTILFKVTYPTQTGALLLKGRLDVPLGAETGALNGDEFVGGGGQLTGVTLPLLRLLTLLLQDINCLVHH